MATYSHRRLSPLTESLLASALLAFIFFSCIDATSRGLESIQARRPTPAAEVMDNSCQTTGAASCESTAVHMSDGTMMQSEEDFHASETASAATAAASDSKAEASHGLRSNERSVMAKESDMQAMSNSRLMKENEAKEREVQIPRNMEPSSLENAESMRGSNKPETMKTAQRFERTQDIESSEGIRGFGRSEQITVSEGRERIADSGRPEERRESEKTDQTDAFKPVHMQESTTRMRDLQREGINRERRQRNDRSHSNMKALESSENSASFQSDGIERTKGVSMDLVDADRAHMRDSSNSKVKPNLMAGDMAESSASENMRATGTGRLGRDSERNAMELRDSQMQTRENSETWRMPGEKNRIEAQTLKKGSSVEKPATVTDLESARHHVESTSMKDMMRDSTNGMMSSMPLPKRIDLEIGDESATATQAGESTSGIDLEAPKKSQSNMKDWRSSRAQDAERTSNSDMRHTRQDWETQIDSDLISQESRTQMINDRSSSGACVGAQSNCGNGINSLQQSEPMSTSIDRSENMRYQRADGIRTDDTSMVHAKPSTTIHTVMLGSSCDLDSRMHGAECRDTDATRRDGDIRGSARETSTASDRIDTSKVRAELTAASACMSNGQDCQIAPEDEISGGSSSKSMDDPFAEMRGNRMSSCSGDHCSQKIASTGDHTSESVDQVQGRNSDFISSMNPKRITVDISSTRPERMSLTSAWSNLDVGEMKIGSDEHVHAGSETSEWSATRAVRGAQIPHSAHKRSTAEMNGPRVESWKTEQAIRPTKNAQGEGKWERSNDIKVPSSCIGGAACRDAEAASGQQGTSSNANRALDRTHNSKAMHSESQKGQASLTDAKDMMTMMQRMGSDQMRNMEMPSNSDARSTIGLTRMDSHGSHK